MLIDPPVGTPQERAKGAVWPGEWIDASPFAQKYGEGEKLSRHTGADLNLNSPTWNKDRGEPVYAIADGIVRFSVNLRGSWGWVIVIEHKDDAGSLFYSRYAHVDHIRFQVVPQEKHVTIGSVIAHIGNADGYYGSADHLHFDISHTKVLADYPGHWPYASEEIDIGHGKIVKIPSELSVKHDYSDPKKFILDHRHPVLEGDQPKEIMKVMATGLRIRPQPNTSEPEIGMLQSGDLVEVMGSISGDGYHFARLLNINGENFDQEGYVAREFLGFD
jgi:murein DD-endopeptidase MepM/ murein hydrolase activator NlpD